MLYTFTPVLWAPGLTVTYGQLCVILLPPLASVSSQECSGSFALVPRRPPKSFSWGLVVCPAVLVLPALLSTWNQSAVGYRLVIPRVGVYAVPERLTMHHFSGGLGGQQEIHVALAKRGLLEADQVKER